MNFSMGFGNHTRWPIMTSETNTPGYWLNWRFLVSLVVVLAAMVGSAVIIWRYEERSSTSRNDHAEDSKKGGILHQGEVWKTCYKSVHPLWLLAYRILAFLLLLGLLIGDVVLHSGGMFFYYTEWTFTLVTIYFGVGSLQSIYGLKSCKEQCVERISMVTADPESAPNNHRDAAGFGDYAVQIIFQMCAGAVVLTDFVFWVMIYPVLARNDYRLNFLAVCMHSVNAICLLGEIALNRLQFPFFRIAYFLLWTCVFVTFLWILHMCVSLWWPYTFLDLSYPYAPLCYFGVGALHVPCFFVFQRIIRTKRYLLARFLQNNGV